jgi:hypothetical protein
MPATEETMCGTGAIGDRIGRCRRGKSCGSLEGESAGEIMGGHNA